MQVGESAKICLFEARSSLLHALRVSRFHGGLDPSRSPASPIGARRAPCRISSTMPPPSKLHRRRAKGTRGVVGESERHRR